MAAEDPDITALLRAADEGDESAARHVYVAVYDELRKIARSHRRRWHGDDTLDTTALINEAYLKLAKGSGSSAWNDRGHFFATAARAMRQILVNYAERRRTAKRGGDAVRVPLQDYDLVDDRTAEEVLGVHNALAALEQARPRECRVVECRVFGGMSVEETARALDVSTATVKRDWASASLALADVLGSEEPSQVG